MPITSKHKKFAMEDKSGAIGSKYTSYKNGIFPQTLIFVFANNKRSTPSFHLACQKQKLIAVLSVYFRTLYNKH